MKKRAEKIHHENCCFFCTFKVGKASFLLFSHQLGDVINDGSKPAVCFSWSDFNDLMCEIWSLFHCVFQWRVSEMSNFSQFHTVDTFSRVVSWNSGNVSKVLKSTLHTGLYINFWSKYSNYVLGCNYDFWYLKYP